MGASIRESQIRLLTPDQKEIAECIGFEAYSKLAAYYGGSRVYVAKLASRYGVSPRRIREIIKKQQ